MSCIALLVGTGSSPSVEHSCLMGKVSSSYCNEDVQHILQEVLHQGFEDAGTTRFQSRMQDSWCSYISLARILQDSLSARSILQELCKILTRSSSCKKFPYGIAWVANKISSNYFVITITECIMDRILVILVMPTVSKVKQGRPLFAAAGKKVRIIIGSSPRAKVYIAGNFAITWELQTYTFCELIDRLIVAYS